MPFDILIVSWNRLERLKSTIATLITSEAARDCQRLIIVDNGSTEPGVQAFLEDMRLQLGAFIVSLPHNRGWGTAVNEAIGLSRAPFVFLSNNDVDYNVFQFHKKMFETLDNQANVGILGVWHHTAHSFIGIKNQWFREMDNVPAVGWLLPKAAMQVVGMLPEKGVCLTKGGNGEDTEYVMRMKQAGFLVGVPNEDIAIHTDGY